MRTPLVAGLTVLSSAVQAQKGPGRRIKCRVRGRRERRSKAGQLAPMIAARPSLADLPDYYPPFQERAVTADMNDNIWVRTTQLTDNRPVYDVISGRGELIDRR
jgi:hypothetical protein